jgi:hypothetical protein
MVKAFTLLLALLIALSFSGMTFAKSLGASSDQFSIQGTLPQGDDTKDDDKEPKGGEPKMDDDKGGDKGEGEDTDKK